MILNSNKFPLNLLLLINQPEVGASGGASGGQRGAVGEEEEEEEEEKVGWEELVRRCKRCDKEGGRW